MAIIFKSEEVIIEIMIGLLPHGKKRGCWRLVGARQAHNLEGTKNISNQDKY